ncbi:unnamed protein product [Rotaria sp. Silwood2]|nr:unnamed protein product [Rotaria sp. Silwood2]
MKVQRIANPLKVYGLYQPFDKRFRLSRSGNFTIYAADVSSFNHLLNELTPILATNGQATAKIYVPRSIQRIKDTEKVAFVKNVDIEIPEGRITEALKDVGLDAIDVVRLVNKI